MVITTLVGGFLVATLVTNAALRRVLETAAGFLGAQGTAARPGGRRMHVENRRLAKALKGQGR